MKVKRYKIKDGTTKGKLIECGFKSGGSWVRDDAELILTRFFENKKIRFEFSINIVFSSGIADWNDLGNVLVEDESFCQPYTPFYEMCRKTKVNPFPALEYIVNTYNDFMSSLPFLEEVI